MKLEDGIVYLSDIKNPKMYKVMRLANQAIGGEQFPWS